MMKPSYRSCCIASVLMAGFLSGCGESYAPDDATDPPRVVDEAPLLPASEALAGAHIPTVDPAKLNDAEIAKGLGAAKLCFFRYASTGEPVLAVAAAPGGEAPDGLVKLNGNLVRLRASAEDNALALRSDDTVLTLTPNPRQRSGTEATLIFEIADDLRVGYSGYSDCG